MKKSTRWLSMLLSVLLLTGCTDPQNTESTTAPETSGAVIDVTEGKPVTAEKTEKALAKIHSLGQSPNDEYRIWYEIFPYAYRDSDGDGIGDLQGITEKLDYMSLN